MTKLLEATYATLQAVPGLMGALLVIGLGKQEVAAVGVVTSLAIVFIGKYLGKPDVAKE